MICEKKVIMDFLKVRKGQEVSINEGDFIKIKEDNIEDLTNDIIKAFLGADKGEYLAFFPKSLEYFRA